MAVLRWAGREVLEEQVPVEVLDLVLEHAGLELGGLDAQLVAVEIPPGDQHVRGRWMVKYRPGTDRQPSS